MAATFSAVSQAGAQPSAPLFVSKLTVALPNAEAYAAGGYAVPAALGSSWQAAAGASRTILAGYAYGVLDASGNSDGLHWHVNQASNKLMAYEGGGLNAPEVEKNDAIAGATTVHVVIISY